MKYIYSILVYALSIVITLYIFPMSISYSRISDTIEIKTLLTKGDHMVTSLNFQKTNLTFGEENKICPNNKCSYEFEKTSFDNGFGAKTLKIEDKANSINNSPVYKFYKISGLFNLVNRQENVTTGEKIVIYEGNLLLDTGNEMFSPSKLEYQSQIKLYESLNKLELIGTSN